MNTRKFIAFQICGLILLVLAAGRATAAGTVEMVVLGEQQPNNAFYEWVQVLTKAGAARVQIRSPRPDDKQGIETRGETDRPVYVVTGILLPSGELQLPGARFRRSDGASLARWIANIAENGPPDSREGNRAAKTAFGLTAAQMEQVQADLATVVGFSTANQLRSDVVGRIAGQLHFPLHVDPSTVQALAENKVAEELSDVARGTALAYVLRSANYCLVPLKEAHKFSYAIVASNPGLEGWPIGIQPEAAAKDVLPGLYEFLTVNIQGVSAARAIEAIGKRLQAPMLVDHAALAHYGIDLEKVKVSAPPGKTFHRQILQRVLFQARLKSELRVDEAGKPFIWITTIKPL